MRAPQQTLVNGNLGPRVRKPSTKLVDTTEIKKRKIEKSDKPLNMSVDNAKNKEEKAKAKNKEEKAKAKNKEEKAKAKNKEEKAKDKNKEEKAKDREIEKRKTEKREKPKETEKIHPNSEKIIEKILSKRNEPELTDQSSSPVFPQLGSPSANMTSWLGYLNSPSSDCESDLQFSMLPGATSWMEPKSAMYTPTCSCQGTLNLLGERVSFLEGEMNKIKKKLKKVMSMTYFI
jgi:flagellar biosynthesis GTPase FlhF